MVESVRAHGILNPVIVRKLEDGYEMLAGHNRMNATRLAGIAEIPAIVKDNLSDEDAYSICQRLILPWIILCF
jgi:ParB family chromosome partitioning protein